MHYFQFHIKDYHHATSHLTNDEDLCYRRMMDLYYENEGGFTDPNWVARRVRMPTPLVEQILGEFFERCESGWVNSRAEREIEAYRSMVDAGKRGANKRWSKGSDAPPIATPLPPDTPPQSDPNSNHKPITNNQSKHFDEFWNAYAKKNGKDASLKQWAKICPDDDLAALIIASAKVYAATREKQYRKDPERWLRGRHWEDEADEVIVEDEIL